MRLNINNQPPLLTLLLSLIIIIFIVVRQGLEATPFVIDGSYGVASQHLYLPLIDIIPTLNKFSALLYMVVGLIVTKLSISKALLPQKSLLPILFYLIFSTSFFNSQTNIIEASTSLLVALSIAQLVKSYNKNSREFNHLFAAGILMGLTPLLLPQSILLFPLIIIGCSLFKRTLNELIVSIGGYLLPILSYSYILWALDYPFLSVFNNIYSSCSDWGFRYFTEFIALDANNLYRAIFFSIIVLISASALVIYTIRDRDHRQTPSGYIFILLCYLGLCTLPTLLISPNNGSLVPILSITFTILTTSFLTQYRNIFTFILYISTLLFCFTI